MSDNQLWLGHDVQDDVGLLPSAGAAAGLCTVCVREPLDADDSRWRRRSRMASAPVSGCGGTVGGATTMSKNSAGAAAQDEDVVNPTVFRKNAAVEAVTGTRVLIASTVFKRWRGGGGGREVKYSVVT